MRILRVALFAALTVLALPALADDAPIGTEAAKALPLFDAHMHYKQDAWETYPPGTVIELMDRAGVAMALVSSSPDDGTITLLEYAPKRIVPEVRPYRQGIGPSNWLHSTGMVDFIRDRLDAYPHRGIGEFHVHGVEPADRALLAEIARMAVERKIPLHVHSGAQPVELFYALEPAITVIWAHAGMSEPPAVIGPLMDRFATLYADTSYREHSILGDGALDPEWKALLLRHSTRFMVGSDTWVNGQWARYGEIIAGNRAWLSLLPREAAENIAFRNAERLFDRPVGNNLLGQR